LQSSLKVLLVRIEEPVLRRSLDRSTSGTIEASELNSGFSRLAVFRRLLVSIRNQCESENNYLRGKTGIFVIRILPMLLTE
jgi:hypothetical protein